jgi:hypothetical protein
MRNSAQHTPFEKRPIYISWKGEMNILLAYLVPPPCTIVLLCPLQGIPGGCWENGGTSGPTNLLKGRRSGPAVELENKLQTIVTSCLHSGFTPRVRSVGIYFWFRKALPGFFLCIFSSITCLKKPVSINRDFLLWKVPVSLSLFLKREKILAPLYVGKGPKYKPFYDFRPVPLAYRPQTEMSNHGRACTQARPFSYTYNSLLIWFGDKND